MAKNRTIPFGYMMSNGEIQVNPKEVLAVTTIFSEYLANRSLSEIAAQMKVPYSDGLRWNKNMVKRILENEKYLGTETYPQLISEEVFKAVNAKKSAKSTVANLLPDYVQKIKNLTVCRECGHKLTRCKNGKWGCYNQKCFRFEYQLTDEILMGTVLNIINAVVANPSLIDADSEIGRYIPNSEIIRQQNEINRMIDNPEIDYDKAKTEIFKLAEMKYQECTYSDIPQKTELLKSILAEYEQLNELDTKLVKACISQIYVSHYAFVEAEFINGVVIRNITERKK